MLATMLAIRDTTLDNNKIYLNKFFFDILLSNWIIFFE